MALRWTSAGLLEAEKMFRRLKAYRQLPIRRTAVEERAAKAKAGGALERGKPAAETPKPAMPASQISTKNGTTPADVVHLPWRREPMRPVVPWQVVWAPWAGTFSSNASDGRQLGPLIGDTG